MKKFLCIVFVMLICSGLFAETRSATSLTGTEWVTFSEDAKYGYVIGFLAGLQVYAKTMYVTGCRTDDSEKIDLLNSLIDWSNFQATVPEMVGALDFFFNKRENGKYVNRQYLVSDLLVYEYMAPWWLDNNGNRINDAGQRIDNEGNVIEEETKAKKMNGSTS